MNNIVYLGESSLFDMAFINVFENNESANSNFEIKFSNISSLENFLQSRAFMLGISCFGLLIILFSCCYCYKQKKKNKI
jgi:hypothetical protein